jgi:hypothetical protein
MNNSFSLLKKYKKLIIFLGHFYLSFTSDLNIQIPLYKLIVNDIYNDCSLLCHFNLNWLRLLIYVINNVKYATKITGYSIMSIFEVVVWTVMVKQELKKILAGLFKT